MKVVIFTHIPRTFCFHQLYWPFQQLTTLFLLPKNIKSLWTLRFSVGETFHYLSRNLLRHFFYCTVHYLMTECFISMRVTLLVLHILYIIKQLMQQVHFNSVFLWSLQWQTGDKDTPLAPCIRTAPPHAEKHCPLWNSWLPGWFLRLPRAASYCSLPCAVWQTIL